MAAQRLRLKFAVTCRNPFPDPEVGAMPFPSSNHRLSETNPKYPLFIAQLLDCFDANKGALKDSCDALGLGTRTFLRVVFEDKVVLDAVQQIRKAHGLGPLKRLT
eukprot:c10250_g1_i1.p2 GENE.c10250_g1_i1~~c10250_g1_i1.p2  ORF type:complete len:105 (-),score=20.10 c10250_g1_i1:105-419(-)